MASSAFGILNVDEGMKRRALRSPATTQVRGRAPERSTTIVPVVPMAVK